MKTKRMWILCVALLLCTALLTACGSTSLLGMLDAINNGGATPGNAYYAASYGNAYATDGNAFATDGNAMAFDAFATNGNAIATNGNAIATNGNAIATNGNAMATNGNAAPLATPTPVAGK